MSPSATLVAAQIGGIDSFVGISTYDEEMLPEAQKNLPVVGDYEKVKGELLTKLKPTSVIVFSAIDKLPMKLREMAEGKAFELASLPFDTLDDLWKSTAEVGRLTGREEAAREKIAECKKAIAAIQKKVSAAKEKPRVMFVLQTAGRVAAEGSDIFFDDMITLAGGINATAEVGRRWVDLNKEACVKLRPDVVIISAPGEAPQRVNDERVERWKNMDVPAAKTGRIHVWTKLNGQMLSLEFAQQVRDMAEVLHPNLMKPTPFDDVPEETPAGRGAP
jgi:ABC-type Fe3+-hydroxamate transport system substrate-binding protein